MQKLRRLLRRWGTKRATKRGANKGACPPARRCCLGIARGRAEEKRVIVLRLRFARIPASEPPSRRTRRLCAFRHLAPPALAAVRLGEIEPLANLIRSLHRSEGLTILIIEHKLREFMQLVETVIAMDFGEIIAVGDPATIVRHPRVVEAYMGKAELDLLSNAPNAGAGDGTA